jgi:tRNA(fMet)-specific endonuclease VapC
LRNSWVADEDPVKRQLATASEMFLPAIVLGELYYGARKSAWSTKNISRIDDFAAHNSILLCDVITAQQYGYTKNVLRAKGRPIPENDIWIAALAVQYNLVLVTRDNHFGEVDGLTIEAW